MHHQLFACYSSANFGLNEHGEHGGGLELELLSLYSTALTGIACILSGGSGRTITASLNLCP